jgi:hypothetical protein
MLPNIVIASDSDAIQFFPRRHSGARVKRANYDVPLHIGESRDSGSGPSDHLGMTKRLDRFANARNDGSFPS